MNILPLIAYTDLQPPHFTSNGSGAITTQFNQTIAIEMILTDVDITIAKEKCAHCKQNHQFLMNIQKRQISCMNNFVITQ